MQDLEKKRTFSDRINDVYRIEIVDLDTLQKVFTFSGKPRGILTMLVLSLLGLFLLFYLIFAFTPLKRTMPGYGDIRQNDEFLLLRKQIVELEKQVEEQEVYNQGLKVLLSNDAKEVVELSEKKLAAEAKKVEAKREKVLSEISDSSNKETKENKPSNNVPAATTVATTATAAAIAALPESKDGDYINQAKINESKHIKKLENLYFVTPITGLVSAGFDVSINHYGTDIVAPKNTPIKSITSGVVIAADWTRETGNTISIQHQNNIIAHYKHNSTLLKDVGDYVSAGEAIAIIGNTGKLTDGPHLHFELWYDGVPVNPENFFTFK